MTVAMARKILKEQWRWGRSSLLEGLEKQVAERRARTKFIEERTALNREQRQREQQQQHHHQQQQDLEQTLTCAERRREESFGELQQFKSKAGDKNKSRSYNDKISARIRANVFIT